MGQQFIDCLKEEDAAKFLVLCLLSAGGESIVVISKLPIHIQCYTLITHAIFHLSVLESAARTSTLVTSGMHYTERGVFRKSSTINAPKKLLKKKRKALRVRTIRNYAFQISFYALRM